MLHLVPFMDSQISFFTLFSLFLIRPYSLLAALSFCAQTRQETTNYFQFVCIVFSWFWVLRSLHSFVSTLIYGYRLSVLYIFLNGLCLLSFLSPQEYKHIRHCLGVLVMLWCLSKWRIIPRDYICYTHMYSSTKFFSHGN